MKSIYSSVSKGYVYDIALKASPLWERNRKFFDSGVIEDFNVYNKRLQRWVAILGNKELLRKRLKCNKLKLNNLPSLLGQGNEKIKRPFWSKTFSSVLKDYNFDNLSEIQGVKSVDSANQLPFERILFPFIQHFQTQIVNFGDSYKIILSQNAKESLERQLLSHLSYIAGLTIGLEFFKFRFKIAPSSSIESIWIQQKPSKVIYDAFTEYMFKGGIITFFQTYPVLARLLCQSVDQWIINISTFCRRYVEDFDKLKGRFEWSVDQPLDSVHELLTFLSDRHNNGQTVIKCVLSTGDSIIYKPRNIQPEIAYNNFIRYFNNFDSKIKLKEIVGLERDDYGWMETVEITPCATKNEVKKFYFRTGMLVSILDILAVTDIHFENLIAAGEHPIIVDLETLLDKFEGQEENLKPKREASLLRIGILPRWQKSVKGKKFDMSGLCADELQDSEIKIFGWKNVNTDQLQLIEDKGTGMSLHHRVSFKSKRPTALEYLSSILEGYREGYFCLLKHKKEMLSNEEVLRQFDGLKLRTIVRNTNTYANIQLHLLHPEYLKDGIDRSIELEWLARPLAGTKVPQEWRIKVYEHERKAMEQLDVPHFNTFQKWSKRAVYTDEDYRNLNRQRDSTIIREKLKLLSKREFLRNIKIIESAIRSRFRI